VLLLDVTGEREVVDDEFQLVGGVAVAHAPAGVVEERRQQAVGAPSGLRGDADQGLAPVAGVRRAGEIGEFSPAGRASW